MAEKRKTLLNTVEPGPEHYLPIMIKIYRDGKLSSALRNSDFIDVDVKFSEPRGTGLNLVNTKPGRIIVVAGGTGLFPYCDLIDLLFKDMMIKKNHEKKE
jgi:NAD(P)H-flavin reductase